MKTIEYYISLPYRLEILPDPDEGGYVVRYPDLPGCITVGDTMHDALANAEDAKRTWIAAALEDGIRITEPESLMNQYCLYLLSRNDALRSPI